MLHKISITLLLVFMGTKVFSQQDSLKMSKYAIIEIGNIITTIFYDNRKVEDLTAILYNTSKNSDNTTISKHPDDTYDYNNSQQPTYSNKIPVAQKALLCIKYMAERNYVLISSVGGAIGQYGSFKYQYIFEKKEK